MKKQLWHFILMLVFAGSSFISCEKPPEEGGPRVLPDDDYEIHTEGIEKTLDEIYLYAQNIYLWNNRLPTIKEFNPAKFAIHKTDKEAIADLYKHITSESQGDDRWSMVIDSSGTLIANSVYTDSFWPRYERYGEFGICALQYKPDHYIVSYVWPGSTAEQAGLKRGQYLSKYRYDVEGNLLICQRVGEAAEITLLSQPDNNYIFTTVTKIEKDDKSTRKVGYLFFDEFTFEDKEMAEKIVQFKKDNVLDLVIDLRYNRGGYFNAMNYLANLIVPNKLSNKTMATKRFNATIETADEKLIVTWPYYTSKAHSRSIKDGLNKFSFSPIFYNLPQSTEFKNIYFIISKNTASAGEIMIKCLQPYAEGNFGLKLIGKTTTGKGVSMDCEKFGGYTTYFVSAITENSDGQNVPTRGIDPDINCEDDFTYALGDPEERCFKRALDELKKSKF